MKEKEGELEKFSSEVDHGKKFREEDLQKIDGPLKAPQPPKGGVKRIRLPKGGNSNKSPVFESEPENKSPLGANLSVRIPSVLHSANPFLYKELKIKAENMRANPTMAEKLLWEKLRNKQLGIKFRQQHVINKFIVDFCSIKSALIIEVDGKIHRYQKDADAERTGILKQEGYKVIRFSNKEIFNDIDKVLSKIQEACPPTP